MKQLSGVSMAAATLLTAGSSLAQSGTMMNGGTWGTGWMGGYGGIWTPILLVIVVAGIVAWIVGRKGK